MKKQGTMVQHPVFIYMLRISGDFFAPGKDLIFRALFCIQAQCTEEVNNRFNESFEIYQLARFPIRDIGKIEVPLIMKNRSAPTQPPGNLNTIFTDKPVIYFSKGILMFSNHDSRFTLPENKKVAAASCINKYSSSARLK